MLDILIVVAAIVLIVLCLLQGGKSDDVISALSGQSSTLFAKSKERGSELFVSRATMGLGLFLFLLVIIKHM